MPSKILIARETPTTWKDSGGDLVMTLNNLAAGAVRIGAQLNLGAGSTPREFTWRLTTPFETAPVVGETVLVYLATSDGTNEDGQLGTADAAGDVNSIRNMIQIGAFKVTSTDAAHDMTKSGICVITTQYVSPAIYNKTADNFKATANAATFTLTPNPPESQTA